MSRIGPAPLPPPVAPAFPAGLPRRVVLFADVNPNLIDGSTIWLQSLARAFAGLPGTEVMVILRDPLTQRPRARSRPGGGGRTGNAG